MTRDFVSQISGQDKPSPNVPSTVTPTTNFSNKLRSPPVPINNIEISQNSMSLSTPCKDSAYAVNYPSGDLSILFFCSIWLFLRNSKCHFYIHTCWDILFYSVPTPPGVSNQSNGYGLHLNGNNFEYSRRVIGATLDTISRPRSRRYDMSNPISYPSY